MAVDVDPVEEVVRVVVRALKLRRAKIGRESSVISVAAALGYDLHYAAVGLAILRLECNLP